MELTAETGKGYVPGRRQPPGRRADRDVFRSTRCTARCARSATRSRTPAWGQELDYDKLTLTVDTDGTISPNDALAHAARILQDQLQLFVHFDEGLVQAPTAARTYANPLDRYLSIELDEIELSLRSASALRNAEIFVVGDLIRMSEAELLRVPNFGRKCLAEIKGVLAAMGMGLAGQD